MQPSYHSIYLILQGEDSRIPTVPCHSAISMSHFNYIAHLHSYSTVTHLAAPIIGIPPLLPVSP